MENPGEIGMHANCGTYSLIVYLRERMKKATVAAKRRERRVGGRIVGDRGKEGKRKVEQLRLNSQLRKGLDGYISTFSLEVGFKIQSCKTILKKQDLLLKLNINF